VIENVGALDGWSILHLLFPFLFGFFLFYRYKWWVGLAVLVLYEFMENTLLVPSTILMGGSMESWANIIGDLVMGSASMLIAMWLRRKISSNK
jgi:hypothetical protein